MMGFEAFILLLQQSRKHEAGDMPSLYPLETAIKPYGWRSMYHFQMPGLPDDDLINSLTIFVGMP
jgi:hypothetical protein